MQFKWVDFCEKHEDEIETWMSDDLIHRFVTNMGIKNDHLEFLSNTEFELNKTYFCKVVLDENVIMAVFIIIMGETYPIIVTPTTPIIIYSGIINPKHRNKGYGTKILNEFVNNAKDIIHYDNNVFEAAAFLNNKPSVRILEKNGFVISKIHPDGDYAEYRYERK